jgi:hypothetical protein
MKMLQIIGSGMLATALVSGAAIADEGRHHMGMGMMDGDRSEYGMMFKERHQMSMDMMTMLKDVMGILKDLNHKPAAEE